MRIDVAEVLRVQRVPAEEIDDLLTTRDREMVRRYLDLHRERLDEELRRHREAVISLERSLLAAIVGSGHPLVGSTGRPETSRG